MLFLRVVIIASSFDELEQKLLVKNCARAREVFGEVHVAYVLGERGAFDACHIIDPGVSFYLIANPWHQRNAALSRSVGFEALGVSKEDIVLFLDGDMLVSKQYLRFLRDLPPEPFLALSARMDIRQASGRLQRRLLRFETDAKGHFKRLYGSIAMRGIDFCRYNIMTHDMEEQWFLRSLESNPVHHIAYAGLGILHFDRFVGTSRKIRFVTSSRGVGVWQGLFRDMSIKRVISDFSFILKQKETAPDLVKFIVASMLAFPKIFIFRIPQRMLYREIKNFG